MAEKTKTAVITKEETIAVMRTATIAEKKIVAAIGTAATIKTVTAMKIATAVAKASKVFREWVIIAGGARNATIIARTSRKDSAASFNIGEKYIWINGNAMAFV